MDSIIVAARVAHFASAMLLFGELVCVLTVGTPVWRDAGGASLAWRQRGFSLALMYGAWILAASVISGAIWLAAEVAIMSDMPLAAAISVDRLRLVLGRTMFGQLWVWRFGLGIVLAVLLLSIDRSVGWRWRLSLSVGAALIAAAYLATLAWSGHAAAAQVSGIYVEIGSDIVHLLAAGAWLGALPGLVLLLDGALPLPVTTEVARRFSTLGLLCVSAVAVSGLGNAWYLVGDVPALIGTDYGRLLLAKVALFAAMVGLAAVNRWSLAGRLNARDPSSRRAERSLRRNAGIEFGIGIIVIAIVGVLGVMLPAAHQSPVWPLDFTLSWLAAQQSLGTGVAVIVAGIVAMLAAGAVVGGILRRRWRLGIAGLAAFVAGSVTFAWLLAVPAYPTTYATSPVRYTTAAIVRGASLYAQNCGVCHGPLGHGDGPAAASLEIVPTDVAAHASSHRVGELFWWIAHGFPGTPMPAFAPRLSDAEIWELAQFLRAQSDAAAATALATALTNHAQPWRYAIVAPDFTFELGGKGQESLWQPQGNPVTLLVLYTLPQSLPYLRALAAAKSAFRTIGLRVIAIPLSGAPDSAVLELAGNGGLFVATAGPEVITAYTMFARQEVDPTNVMPVHIDYLIDRQGYVRARWLGIPDSPPARAAEVFDQADLLYHERQRAPTSAGHVHY
jgi:putative copper resistance protein D